MNGGADFGIEHFTHEGGLRLRDLPLNPIFRIAAFELESCAVHVAGEIQYSAASRCSIPPQITEHCIRMAAVVARIDAAGGLGKLEAS